MLIVKISNVTKALVFWNPEGKKKKEIQSVYTSVYKHTQ